MEARLVHCLFMRDETISLDESRMEFFKMESLMTLELNQARASMNP